MSREVITDAQRYVYIRRVTFTFKYCSDIHRHGVRHLHEHRLFEETL